MTQHHKREIVPLTRLKPAPYNPREIDEESMTGLRKSLDRFGVVQEVVANERTGHIVGGHQRVKALRDQGVESVPVVWVDLDDDEERALNFALNSQHLSGSYTPDVRAMIEDLSARVPDLVDDLRLDLIADSFADIVAPGDGEPAGNDGGDGEGDADAPADSEPGRVYALGPHRVACGDSANSDTIDQLMRGKRADLVLTDPPYNVVGDGSNYAANLLEDNRPRNPNARGSGAAYGELAADGWDSGFSFRDIMPNLDRAAAPDSSVYVFTSHFLIGEVLEEVGEFFRYTGLCIWSKPNPMPSLAKRHWTWSTELVVYGTRGAHTFNFPDSGHALNVWTFPSVAAERRAGDAGSLHPTQKPLPVIEHAMTHSSKRGQLVLDLFLGSGTTLIAAARLGRVCYGVEREPKYVDTIRRRWAEWARSVGEDPGPDAL